MSLNVTIMSQDSVGVVSLLIRRASRGAVPGVGSFEPYFQLVFRAGSRRIKRPHGSCGPLERCQSGLSSGLGKAV